MNRQKRAKKAPRRVQVCECIVSLTALCIFREEMCHIAALDGLEMRCISDLVSVTSISIVNTSIASFTCYHKIQSRRGTER